MSNALSRTLLVVLISLSSRTTSAQDDAVLQQIQRDWINRQSNLTRFEFVMTGYVRIEKYTIWEPEFFRGAHPHVVTCLPYHRVLTLDFARRSSRYESQGYSFIVVEQKFKPDLSTSDSATDKWVADARVRPLFLGFGLLDVVARPDKVQPNLAGWRLGHRDASDVVTLTSPPDDVGWVKTIDVDLSKQSAVTRYDCSRGRERRESCYINYLETRRGWFPSNWIWQDYDEYTLHRTEYTHLVKFPLDQ